MLFHDLASLSVEGGHGGPGCVSFRRETFVPRGGPDGGDGGRGGGVIFVGSGQLATLRDFKIRSVYRAPAGLPGRGARKSGRDGDTLYIRVPVGTLIEDAQTGELLADFREEGMEWHACKGGRGGKGNTHFATSTHQAPKFAQPGEPGEKRDLKLTLKLMADVGLIGFPNAGKSTLLASLTRARPKIADYPFTTLTPQLGIFTGAQDQPLVIADIPGLIEDAHLGVGLGHQFLQHMERTTLLLYVLDAEQLLVNPSDTRVLARNYRSIQHELTQFNVTLGQKTQLVVINKIDLWTQDQMAEAAARALQLLQQEMSVLEYSGVPLLWCISCHSGQGIDELSTAVKKILNYGQSSRASMQRQHLLPHAPELR